MTPSRDTTGKPEAETRACFLPDSETEAYCELAGPPEKVDVATIPAGIPESVTKAHLVLQTNIPGIIALVQRDGTYKPEDRISLKPYEAPLDPMTGREYIFDCVKMADHHAILHAPLSPMEYARTLKGRKRR